MIGLALPPAAPASIVWTAFTPAISATAPSGDLSGQTILIKIPVAQVLTGQTYFRLTIKGASSSGSIFNNITVCNVARGGVAGVNTYDAFQTPVAVKFSGTDSVSLQTSETKISDTTTFSADGAIIVGFNVSAGPMNYGTLSGATRYTFASPVQEADDPVRSAGYGGQGNRTAGIVTLEYGV